MTKIPYIYGYGPAFGGPPRDGDGPYTYYIHMCVYTHMSMYPSPLWMWWGGWWDGGGREHETRDHIYIYTNE